MAIDFKKMLADLRKSREQKPQTPEATVAKKEKPQYDNTNQGALFVNDKAGNDKRPDKTGKLVIKADDFQPDAQGNVTIWLAAWTRDSERVGEYLSLKATPPKDE